MHIIIAGHGKVGITLLQQLSQEGHDLTLIDMNRTVLDGAVTRHDVMAVQGNCAAQQVLLDAGVMDAALLIAVTGADEVNLLSSMPAHGLNPNLHTIARIRNPEYTQQIHQMRDLFAHSKTVNEEAQAAKEMERLMKLPGFLRRDTFAKGKAEIVELRIDEKSKLNGISLIEMYRTIKCKVLVCAVLRNGTAITPGGHFVLKEGDRIFVTAPTSELAILLKNLGILTRRVRSCLIGGGGRISYYLAQLLEKGGIHVRIIEKNPERCRELAELLPSADILQGDFSARNELEDGGLLISDAFLAMSGLDEMNIITALYATSRGVPQVITKLGHAGNYTLAGDLSIGSMICPREHCSNEIVRYVRAMENQTGAAISLHTIADGQVQAVEFVIEETTRNCGVALKDLKLKSNVLLATISKNGQVEIPNGASTIEPGDTVVVVTTRKDTLQNLNDIFA